MKITPRYMITEIRSPRLRHAFEYADKLLYTSYYNDIVRGIKISLDCYNETLNWFIGTEEYEKCAQIKKCYETI